MKYRYEIEDELYEQFEYVEEILEAGGDRREIIENLMDLIESIELAHEATELQLDWIEQVEYNRELERDFIETRGL